MPDQFEWIWQDSFIAQTCRTNLTQLLQHNGAISVKHWWSSMLENLQDRQQQKELKLLHILPAIYGKKRVAESSMMGR